MSKCGLFCSACSEGTDDPSMTRHLTRRYLTAFLNVYVRQQAQYVAYLSGPPAEPDVALGLVQIARRNGM